jgi:hypothetical protein
MKAAAGVPALRFNPGKPSQEQQQLTANDRPADPRGTSNKKSSPQ